MHLMSQPHPSVTSSAMLEGLRDPANQAAWSALDERYRPVIRGLALRLGVGAEDAADVAQQTLFDVLQGYRQGNYDREKGRMRTWIMTIARRRVMDVFRMQHRRANGASNLDWSESSGSSPSEHEAELAWADAEEKAVLSEALRLMFHESQANDATKRAFEMVMIQGLSETVAARECGMTVDQVYVAKHRMLKKLREQINLVQELWRADEWR